MGIMDDTRYICMGLLILGLNAVLFASYAKGADLTAFFKLSSPERAQFVDGGQEIQLSLEEIDGSGFMSYSEYLFGVFNMRVKMVAGNSAGTVTTFYFTSSGETHDELDFEFLGNETGQPIILQTNVYASGVGNREQRLFLWFDPTADFHNYTILWNTHQVVFYVDGIPIRVYPNIESATGVPYLKSQPMGVYGTIWDGDSWATQGGTIKIDWTQAPFNAFYRDFNLDACADAEATTSCALTKWWNQQKFEALDNNLLGQLNWVKEKYMVYDYCTDYKRFNVTPTECYYSTPTPTPPTPPPSPIPTPSSSAPPSSPTITNPSSNFSPSSPLTPPVLAPSPLHSTSPPPFHFPLSHIAFLVFSIFFHFFT